MEGQGRVGKGRGPYAPLSQIPGYATASSTCEESAPTVRVDAEVEVEQSLTPHPTQYRSFRRREWMRR